MATFVWIPTAATLSHEVFKIAGGKDDGCRRVWSLTFQNRADATATEIEAFLRGTGRPIFDWTPPTGDAGQWVCEVSSLESEVVPPGRRTVSAVFKEWW